MKKNPPISCIDEYLVGGIPRHPSENHGVRTSWDDEIPNIYIYMENKNHVPNHQPVDVYHCGSISFINPRYAGVYQKQRMVFTCFGPVFQIHTEAQGVDKHIYIYLVYLDPPSTHYQNGMFHDVYPIMLVLLLITSFMGAWRV